MRTFAKLAVAAAAVATLAAMPASAQDRVEAGLLECTVAAGTGFVVGSSKDMSCIFKKAAGGTEAYVGRISRFGLDIGHTTQTQIIWAVLGPAADIPPGTLAGNYGGLSAEATVGVGVGGNAMIGGNNKAIVLQPFSAQAQTGIDIAAGVSAMELRLAN